MLTREASANASGSAFSLCLHIRVFFFNAHLRLNCIALHCDVPVDTWVFLLLRMH